MRITGHFRRLTPDEERELALQRLALGVAWKTSEARKTLIECNIAWAVKIAHQHGNPRLGDDNFSVAMEGLVRAVDYFDPTKGRLTTYLAKAIRQSICRAMMEETFTIHVPEYVQAYVVAIDRGESPRVKRDSVKALVPDGRRAMVTHCIDGLYSSHYRLWTMRSVADMIIDRNCEPPDDADRLDGTDQFARVMGAIDELPEDFSRLVRLHHLDDPPMSFEEIGRHLGMPKSTVRHKIDGAYRMIRKALTSPAAMTA